MTIAELKERLERLDEERTAAERELEALRSRQERIEELENDAAIVLAFYAAFAGVDLGRYPPEERRRLYEAMGLKATAYAHGKVEVDMQSLRAGHLPTVEEARKMVERIISERKSERKRDKAYQEKIARMDAELRRAGLEHVIPEERRSVMPREITSR